MNFLYNKEPYNFFTCPRVRCPQSCGDLGSKRWRRAILDARGGSNNGELRPSQTLASITGGNFPSTNLFDLNKALTIDLNNLKANLLFNR